MPVEIGDHPLDGEDGGDKGKEDPDGHGLRIEGLHHDLPVFEGVIARGGTQGDHAQQEAVLDGRGQAQAHQHAADDGDQAAADPRPHGDTLGDAYDQRHLPGQIVQGACGTDKPVVSPIPIPSADNEDRQPPRQPGRHHRPGTEEPGLDDLIEQKPDDRRRQKACRHVDQQTTAQRIAADKSLEHLQDAAEVEAQDRDDGPCLDADGIGVGRLFFPLLLACRKGRVLADLHDLLGQQQVARRADRQIFRQALHDAQDYGLAGAHLLFGWNCA